MSTQSEIEKHIENLKVIRQDISNVWRGRAGLDEELQALTFFIGVGNKLASPGEIEKILLDTCKKELNQNIGFMLTDNDVRIFARSILAGLGEGSEHI